MVVLLFVTAQFDAAVCAFATTLRKIYFAPALARTRVRPFTHLLLASYTNCALQHDFQHITQCKIYSKLPTLTCTNCTCTCTNLHGVHGADFSVIRCGNFCDEGADFLCCGRAAFLSEKTVARPAITGFAPRHADRNAECKQCVGKVLLILHCATNSLPARYAKIV